MKQEQFDNADSGKKDKLLREFERPDYSAWRAEAESGLKGAPFEKKLFSKTYEGISLKPIYNEDDLAGIAHLSSFPGAPDYVRGIEAARDNNCPWLICQKFDWESPVKGNETLKSELKRGLDAVRLAKPIADIEEMKALFKDIDITKYPIFMQPGATGIDTTAMLTEYMRFANADIGKLRGCIEVAPITTLEKQGFLQLPLIRAYDDLAACVAWASKEAPMFRSIAVDMEPAHNAGASAREELAFALATGVEYLREMINRNIPVDTSLRKILFIFPVRGDFFMEMSKLRAGRMLWSRVVEAFGGGKEAGKMAVHAKTSVWTKTACDPYVNMLREVTETLSAVLGGAASIEASPFNVAFERSSEFSDRIARNAQILLRDESRTGEVIDPAGGSYFVENLTDELAAKAWSLFQEIEGKGGMSQSLKQGFPQEILKAVADSRFSDLTSLKSVMVGTNKYVNSQEKPTKTWGELRHYSTKTTMLSDDSLKVEPFIVHRASIPYERMRSAVSKNNDKTGSALKVFLANMGPIAQHKARADFSTGFFEVGGFEVIGNNGFSTPEQAAAAAASSGSLIAVICSTDDSYPVLAPRFVHALKEKSPLTKVILAGYPTDQIEALKTAGVDEFIHIKSNNYNVLVKLLLEIGVAL